ncbi:ESX secretion-associated protein EspG [Pseudonocardia spinosispora]|uniref:ESX secretion-associated protein EspG n=1 Tax=Pseudonocardia spinosispora TaxID=103441 RepID=UPI00042926B2|nr:ESX secretion-associated protein EspG [Pseudonocardia spinosispora]
MSTAVAADLTLSAVELDACWELLELGDTPETLLLPSPGRDRAERREILGDVLAELASRGLADRSSPVESLARPLRVLAAPDHQVDLRLGGEPHGTVVAIGAVAGSLGAALVQYGDRIQVQSMRPTQIMAALLGLCGPIRPGVGRPVNVPADLYDAAQQATTDGNLWTMADNLVSGGLPRADASSWVRMCTGVRSFGQLGVTFWPEGARRPGRYVVGFHHTETGHYLQLRRPPDHGNGRATVTVCPVDAHRLARLTEELLAAGY